LRVEKNSKFGNLL